MGKKSKGKGKAPKGRAGAKQKAKQSGQRGSDGLSSFIRASGRRDMVDDEDDNFIRFKGFAQQNNNSPANPRNGKMPFNSAPLVKYRHQKISFVSAGSNTPAESDTNQPTMAELARYGNIEESDEDDEDDEESDDDGEDFDDSTLQTNIVTDADVEVSQGGVARMSINGSKEEHEHRQVSNDDMMDTDVGVEHAQAVSPDIPLFVVDTVGDPSLNGMSRANGKRPVQRSTSPACSDSSEEVIVFHGRNKARVVDDPIQAPANRQPTPQQQNNDDAWRKLQQMWPQSEQQQTTQQLPERKKLSPSRSNTTYTSSRSAPSPQPARAEPAPAAIGWGSHTSKLDEQVNNDTQWAPAPAGSWWKKNGMPRPDLDPPAAEQAALFSAPPRETKVAFAEPELQAEETAEETIASLQAAVRAAGNAKGKARQSVRAATDPHSPKAATKRGGKRGRKKDNRRLRAVIDDEDEEDMDEAAYDDYMANLQAQLDGAGDPENGSQISYATFGEGPSLVVNGKEIGDDEVLEPGLADVINGGNADDDSSDDSELIGQDWEDMSNDTDEDIDASGLNSSELEDELEYTEREQWEDEEDLRLRRQERKTDEQIARLFAKQHELGIDCDEIVIDDGAYDMSADDMDGIGDLGAARAGLKDISNFSFSTRPFRTKNGLRRRSGKRTNGNDHFPDASMLADTVEQYGENGFDIMDFDRPSLKPKKKGRKSKMPPEIEYLTDEELKEDLSFAWDNDRAKKRLKKAEREELRSQGLLGSMAKKGKADLSQKYQNGISISQIHAELRIFMQDDGQRSRPFPPMLKEDRKALHEIAQVLNLKSKSVGTGQTRFPVLYKTSLSIYEEESFDKAVELSKRGLLEQRRGKLGKHLAKKNAKTLGGRGGKVPKAFGGGTAAATVHHGQAVGQGAAEIGAESFGHKLMEKMGWSKGMALGREGEGRLVPVEQFVKMGRAGLG